MAMSFEEYVNAYYGGVLGISKRYGIKKAEDVLTTADTAYFNTMYGASVFHQLNTKSEVFKLLPKEGWTQSGWRVLKTRGASASNAGVAEGAAFPETDVPDLDTVVATIKEIVTPWDVSTRAEFLSEADDGVKGLTAYLRREQAEHHAFYIDAMMMVTASTADGNNFESLDRITLSNARCAVAPYSAGENDIYDLDRTVDTWSNAYTDSASNTDKDLELGFMDSAIQSALENGANYDDLIFLTNHAVLQDIKALVNVSSNATWRYDLGPRGQGTTRNGATSEAGMNLDSRVGYYDSIPIFVTQHVTGVDNRLYLLDMAHLKMKLAAPTTYVANEDLGILQKLAKEYAYITAGELICTKFTTQGSIRDLN